MKKFSALIMLIVAIPALSACSQRVSVENVVSAPLGASANATLEQIDAMIEQVCFRRNWKILEQKPGEMTASYSVSGDKHRITAKITYDTQRFSITYLDSHNMNYRPVGNTGQIHPKYNIWVNQLRQDIEVHAPDL